MRPVVEGRMRAASAVLSRMPCPLFVVEAGRIRVYASPDFSPWSSCCCSPVQAVRRTHSRRPHRSRQRSQSRARQRPASATPARRTRRRASCCCDRPGRRPACSARRGATTRPASGSRTAAAASSSPGRPRRGGTPSHEPPASRAQRRLPALRRREGPDLFPALQLRALSESAEPRRDLRRRLRQHPRPCSAARTCSCRSSSRRSRAGSSRRSSATTSTSGRRTRRRAIRRRSSAPAT